MNLEKQKCSRCKIFKLKLDFNIPNKTCNACRNSINNYKKLNRDKINESKKIYYEKNKDNILEKNKEYYIKNKDNYQQYRDEYKEERKQYDKIYNEKKKKDKIQINESIKKTQDYICNVCKKKVHNFKIVNIQYKENEPKIIICLNCCNY
jgi:hypothetical protein